MISITVWIMIFLQNVFLESFPNQWYMIVLNVTDVFFIKSVVKSFFMAIFFFEVCHELFISSSYSEATIKTFSYFKLYTIILILIFIIVHCPWNNLLITYIETFFISFLWDCKMLMTIISQIKVFLVYFCHITWHFKNRIWGMLLDN